MKLSKRTLALGIAAAIALPAAVFGVSAAGSALGFDPAMLSGSVAGAAGGAFANCTALNKVYAHGVGKTGARDTVSGSTKPVTTFTVNAAVYTKNAGSDRDKDGIACEKK